MPTSKDYLRKAEECAALASEAKTETDRVACLDLAQTWLDAAAREDQATAEGIAPAQKFAPEWTLRETSQLGETPQPKASSGWRKRVLGLFRWQPPADDIERLLEVKPPGSKKER